MPISLRPATAGDEKKIKSLIHEVGINPISLEWRRFIVAEDDGEFVGCGQLKPHSDGAIEMASLAVVPARQGAGIGTMLVRALIERGPQVLYLMCQSQLAPYYRRFGFEEIGPEDMPRSLKVYYRAGKVFAPLIHAAGISIMRRVKVADSK